MAIVATAKHHTLAATVSGQLYSWGGEKFGKLGHHSEKTLDEDKICTYPKYVEGDLKKGGRCHCCGPISFCGCYRRGPFVYMGFKRVRSARPHFKGADKANMGQLTMVPEKNQIVCRRLLEKSNGTMKQLNFFRNRSSSKGENHSVAGISEHGQKAGEIEIWALPTRVTALSIPKRMVDRGKWPKSQLMRLVRVQYSVLDVFGNGVIASHSQRAYPFLGRKSYAVQTASYFSKWYVCNTTANSYHGCSLYKKS